MGSYFGLLTCITLVNAGIPAHPRSRDATRLSESGDCRSMDVRQGQTHPPPPAPHLSTPCPLFLPARVSAILLSFVPYSPLQFTPVSPQSLLQPSASFSFPSLTRGLGTVDVPSLFALVRRYSAVRASSYTTRHYHPDGPSRGTIRNSVREEEMRQTLCSRQR